MSRNPDKLTDAVPTCQTCGSKTRRAPCQHCGANPFAAADPAHVARLTKTAIKNPEDTHAV